MLDLSNKLLGGFPFTKLSVEQEMSMEDKDSPWSSLVVMVKKEDGTNRFCIVYRQLNELTINDAFPLHSNRG